MSRERIKGALARWIETRLTRLDYLALYPARVVSQAQGDGTLTVRPEDPRLPTLERVPVRLGLPGATVKVLAGGSVLVGFEGGDPRYPVALLWRGGTIEEVVIDGSVVALTRADHVHTSATPGSPTGPAIAGASGVSKVKA